MAGESAALNVVFMGDSMTFGQYIDPRTRWTELVQRAVREEYGTRAENFWFINSGISGNTTRMGLERFPHDVQQYSPDIMTLQFGLNDGNCWDSDNGLPRCSAPAFRANLVEMIDRARAFGARQIIVQTNSRTLRHEKMCSGYSMEEANEKYSVILREVAREKETMLCDVREAFEPFSQEELAELILPDLLHLSEKGSKVWAAAITPLLFQAIDACIAADSSR